jgi:chemotaxis protein MotB
MTRRKREDQADNHERWLVSYADFITLLFAFFVVMYALSTVNEGKYRVLSDSMTAAFRNVEVNRSAQLPVIVTPAIPTLQKNQAAKRAEAERQKRRDRMRNVARELMEAMAPLIERGEVRIVETDRGITIEINDSILFAPGQAVLNPLSAKAMQSIAQVLAPMDLPITIEGHTDNVPINTPQFPSNWELSAVRATTVLRLFIESGVAPGRLTAIGYADTRPVESNDLAEGRARNRRVTILIDFLAGEGREGGAEGAPAPAGNPGLG